ncbi:MAG: T9SS type A sorting domain-containing protein [Candidatus Eisenbacteria bacterium]|nr:T9SS type A sorting domain-containing protein [Candidatus Eisenbacteria bacterium]
MNRLRWIIPALIAVGLGIAGPARSTDLYALLNTGELHRSPDGGATWMLRAAIPADAVALVAGVSSTRLHLASESGEIFRSLDSGGSWAAIGTLNAPDVTALAFRSDGHLLALTRSGIVFFSTDDGVSFTALTVLPASNMVSLTSTPGGVLFGVSRTGEVFRSGDLGSTWLRQAALPVSDAHEIVARSGDLFVMSRSGLLNRSSDGGITWSAASTLNQVYTGGLVSTAAGLFAATEQGHVAHSVVGNAWTWVGSVNQVRLRALASGDPQVSGIPGNAPQPRPSLTLGPAFPNPAPGRFQVDAILPGSAPVRMRLIDAAGRLVAEQFEAGRTAGPHLLSWPQSQSSSSVNRPSGIYWLEVTQGSARAVTKVLLQGR